MNDKQIADFYHRSYTAVDGLWFMKVEEKFGFDAALTIDHEVWKVLPKIQARMLKSMAKLEKGMRALFEGVTTKLTLEGFTFRADRAEGDRGFRVTIDRCPWHELMVKSERKHLSEKVGTLICKAEYLAWASEFDEDIRFELEGQICGGSESCGLRFGY